MSQSGILYVGDVGRTVRLSIGKTVDIDAVTARVMVTAARVGTSSEWEVSIDSQTDTRIVLSHVLTAESLPTAGNYAWRAYFYDVGGGEIDSTAEGQFTVRAASVDRPT